MRKSDEATTETEIVEDLYQIFDMLVRLMATMAENARNGRHSARQEALQMKLDAVKSDLKAAAAALGGTIVGGVLGFMGAGMGLHGTARSRNIALGRDDLVRARASLESARDNLADAERMMLQPHRAQQDLVAPVMSRNRHSRADAANATGRIHSELGQGFSQVANGMGDYFAARYRAEGDETRAHAEHAQALIDEIIEVIDESIKTRDKALEAGENLRRSGREAAGGIDLS